MVILLALCLLPCLALAEELLPTPIQVDRPIDFLQDVTLLPDGNLLLRYYSLNTDDAFWGTFGKVGQIYDHIMAIITPSGELVKTIPGHDYELAVEQNSDDILLLPEGFRREYSMDGTGETCCWTEYDLAGNVVDLELQSQPRTMEYVRNLPHYRVAAYNAPDHLEVISLATGASANLPVDESCIAETAEADGCLVVLSRADEGDAIGVIRVYDSQLQLLRSFNVPFRFIEVCPMVYRDGTLYCFPMYSGDWESYHVYRCDLATGVFAPDTILFELPTEDCGLSGIIPTADGFLLLIDENINAPFAANNNFNFTDKNLYRLSADGTLTLCMDLHGNALLVPQTDDRTFTLVQRSRPGSAYALCTYTLP